MQNIFIYVKILYFLSSSPNNSSFVIKITFNFDEVVFLEAILVDTTYATRGQTRTFTGFPTALNIYSSIDDEPFVLNAIFIWTTVYPWTRVQFVFPNVIKCNKLIFECNELTTTGKGKYVFLAGLTFIKDPSHSTVPTENLTYLPIVDVCQSGIPCSYEGTPDHQVVITINSTSFTSVSNEEDGGAIKLTNAGIVCENITFDRCNSKSGGGGSIYINNDISQNNDIIINNVSFSNCKAKFGGAVFVHTESFQENVNIINCIFKTCQALSFSESESLIGGSALFLFSKQSNIYECTFSKNIGESQLKFSIVLKTILQMAFSLKLITHRLPI